MDWSLVCRPYRPNSCTHVASPRRSKAQHRSSTRPTVSYRLAFRTRCGAHVFGLVEGSDEMELHLGSFDETNPFTPPTNRGRCAGSTGWEHSPRCSPTSSVIAWTAAESSGWS